MKSPLLVLMIRAGNLEDSKAHVRVLRQTFDVAPSEEDGEDTREMLQPGEIREIRTSDRAALAALSLPFLSSSARLLVIILDARSQESPLDDLEIEIMAKLQSVQDIEVGNYSVLSIHLHHPGSLFASQSNPALMRLGLEDLDERDLRLPFLSLYALDAALRIFQPKRRLFFSHAKRDGVPLTTATLDWMSRLKGFDAFYDTKNLNLAGDIDKQLEQAVQNGIVVVFRSDVFDQRYWCQKEVLWAEENGRPIVTVDARWRVEYRPSVLSFDCSPAVRIPDGSVVRILTAALTEALRVELFAARVHLHRESMVGNPPVATIPRVPSLVSLQAAFSKLTNEAKPGYVVYPNPALPKAIAQAAASLAAKARPGCIVESLDEFRLERA